MHIDRREFIVGAASAVVASGCAKIGERPVVRFGMVTDLHYATKPSGIDDPGMRCFDDAPLKLQDCIKVMNARNVDFLIELGDFKDMVETKEGTLKCLDYIEKVYATFNGGRYHVLGNHEVDCITKGEFLARISNTGQEKARAYYSFMIGDVTGIVLDANYTSQMADYEPGKFDFRDTNVPPSQIKWLQGVLDSAPGTVIVFAHQLMDPACDDIMRINNAAELREMFEKSGKVKAVFAGHHHVGLPANVHNGILYYTLRAMAQDAYPENNSFVEVEVYDSGRIVVNGFVKASSFDNRI